MAKRICDPTSGKIGNQVYQGGKFGQVVRTRAIPTNPKTTDQTNARAILTTCAKAWKTISEANRLLWNAAATTVKSSPRLGMSGILDGEQLFVQVNANRLTVGNDLGETPPPVPEIPPIPVTGLTITNTAGVITLKLTTTGTPVDATMLRVSKSKSPGVYRTPELNYVGTLDSPTNNAIDISTVYKAKYGSPAVGNKVWVSVNSNVEGYVDTPLVFSATVPAAT